MICRFCIGEFSPLMIWLSVFDLVRRWPAPAEQGVAIRLPWLTDSLRKGYGNRRFLSRQIRDTDAAKGNSRCCHAPFASFIFLAKIFPHFSDWPSLRSCKR